MTLLEAREVSKRFAAITALDDVSLTVEQGEAVGLIGPNGAGKTTFFNCLLGLLRPDGGQVRHDHGLSGEQRLRGDVSPDCSGRCTPADRHGRRGQRGDEHRNR